jgi:hypothetical protein
VVKNSCFVKGDHLLVEVDFVYFSLWKSFGAMGHTGARPGPYQNIRKEEGGARRMKGTVVLDSLVVKRRR